MSVKKNINTLPRKGIANDLVNLRLFLKHHLLQEIIPFWEKVGPDAQGGFNTCLNDDGSVLSRDKYLWGQWRAVWVFARLFNSFGKEPRWLVLAEQIAEFAIRHGWDENGGGWCSVVGADGNVKEGPTSIYSAGFALYGLAELYRATKNPIYLDWLNKTVKGTEETLQLHHDKIPHSPYPVPKGARMHGIPMIFSLTFHELGELLNEPRFLAIARDLQDEIFDYYYRPEWDLIVERVSADGQRFPGLAGSAVVPGHVIEDMWFQIHIAKSLGRPQIVDQAVRLIQRHLEFGWDAKYGGGILLAKDAAGHDTADWHLPDMKLWWPHTEALYACLLAYYETGALWTMEWYQKILDYSLQNFYMPEIGEWRQKLTRENKPFDGVVAYPVKDPFHLPRSLILQIELLERGQNAANGS